MKKTLCTLLILCGLLLSACGGNTTVDPTPTKSQSDNTVPTDTATETEPADRTYLDDLPDGLDYGGYDFRVLVYEGGNLPTGDTGAWLNYFALEGETGETSITGISYVPLYIAKTETDTGTVIQVLPVRNAIKSALFPELEQDMTDTIAHLRSDTASVYDSGR